MERAMRFEPTTLTLASDQMLSICLILNDFHVGYKCAKALAKEERRAFRASYAPEHFLH